MNRKGFTLIELLAVIVLIGIIGVLIVPGLLNNVETSKQASYNTLIQNIVTSSQIYYEECEYGDLTDINKYGIYGCNTNPEERENYLCFMDISNNTITTTLGAIANTGLLTVNNTITLEDGSKIKVVLNPMNDKDISDCQITIKKTVEENKDENGITNYKVTYKITSISEQKADGTVCPTTYEGVE